MNYFIYIISHLTGRYELNKLTSLPMCGFKHRTGIMEVTGSNPVEALIFFFRLLHSNCLNWNIHCDDHSSLSSITAVHIYELFHIYFTSHQRLLVEDPALEDELLTISSPGLVSTLPLRIILKADGLKVEIPFV